MVTGHAVAAVKEQTFEVSLVQELQDHHGHFCVGDDSKHLIKCKRKWNSSVLHLMIMKPFSSAILIYQMIQFHPSYLYKIRVVHRLHDSDLVDQIVHGALVLVLQRLDGHLCSASPDSLRTNVT